MMMVAAVVQFSPGRARLYFKNAVWFETGSVGTEQSESEPNILTVISKLLELSVKVVSRYGLRLFRVCCLHIKPLFLLICTQRHQ